MCGFIYVDSNKLNKNDINLALGKISFRGPDFQKTERYEGQYFLSHCRLSILDLNHRSNQPMISKSKRYSIIFNGEIYNYLELAQSLNLELTTTSDTEVIVEGYEKIGIKIFELLDGMFSLVIHDHKESSWIATRDLFGIKPLYIYQKNNETIISSETKAISELKNLTISSESINEWEIFRSPIPGKSFFKEIDEVLPGQIVYSNGQKVFHSFLENQEKKFQQDEFENLLQKSIRKHCLSDVENVSLISGGLDSSIVCFETNFENYYSVGLIENNEFSDVEETSRRLNKYINLCTIDESKLKQNWISLTKLKGEPLSVPNESLIYEVCTKFNPNEKVLLTGEGADELLFGYDRIFRWGLNESFNLNKFLNLYSYSNSKPTERFIDFIQNIKKNKTNIEFLEDFFIKFHLPVLLRRMDFASMAAGKEARVPFVDKSLFNYLYRSNPKVKINKNYSKIPLRNYAKKRNLDFLLKRKKIGFSAKINFNNNNLDEYSNFRNIVISNLGWDEYAEKK